MNRIRSLIRLSLVIVMLGLPLGCLCFPNPTPRGKSETNKETSESSKKAKKESEEAKDSNKTESKGAADET